jgi:RIO kinase 2
MKLDATVIRTMSKDDFRVMEAVEEGMRNHIIVPLPLISTLARLRHGGVTKIITSLLRDKLLSHEKSNPRNGTGYDGYRLTTAGYDVLALHTLKITKVVAAILGGNKIGTGKESDVYLGVDPEGKHIVLKFHRLGRTSFRNVRNKRDYFANTSSNQAHSWLFFSKASAQKEYAFMKALHDIGRYTTPIPIAYNRHVVVMSLVHGIPLYQLHSKSIQHEEQVQSIYTQAVTYLLSLVQNHGLIHCDFNEYNLLVDLSGGVQSRVSAPDDPYVRHSGIQSVVTNQQSVGMLSKPAWEQALLDEDGQEGQDQVSNLPKILPQSGLPVPVVTLIDFPQMISIHHVNAQEYFERDLACLQKFFAQKLGYPNVVIETPQPGDNDNDSDSDNDIDQSLKEIKPQHLKWANIVKKHEAGVALLKQENLPDDAGEIPESEVDKDTAQGEGISNDASVADSRRSASTARSKSQRPLDAQLKASGYHAALKSSRQHHPMLSGLLSYVNDYNVHRPPPGSSAIVQETVGEVFDEEDENESEQDEDPRDEDHSGAGSGISLGEDLGGPSGQDATEGESVPLVGGDVMHFEAPFLKRHNAASKKGKRGMKQGKLTADERASTSNDPDGLGDRALDVAGHDGVSTSASCSRGVSHADLDDDEITVLTRLQIEGQVRDRVRQHLAQQKQKSRQQGAFRTRNQNKTYLKGKRILADAGL